jgi:cellulose synthase operon protein C
VTRLKRGVLLFVFCGACVCPAWGAGPDDCALLRKHGRLPEAKACYESLTASKEPYLRAEGDWGLGLYEQANNEFRTAVAQADKNALYRVRWGMLLHERFNNKDADDLFNEALQRDPKNARAFLGLAIVSADGFDSKAIDWAGKALQADPKLAEAHELLAKLLLEDSDTDKAVEQADEALKISTESLDAMAIHAAVEVIADRSPAEWLAKVKQVNPTYGEAYATIGHFLELNYRYGDAIDYYRKAVELDPQLWPAHSELGIDLMRMGQEDEPKRQLEMSYDNGYRDAATVNSLRLLDSYKNFVTFKDDTTILKLQKKEADLLYPYFVVELKRDIADYEKKYKMKVPGVVQVEVYPDHEDFAVRTAGMPGLGALGVTFNDVIAMDSPSGREPGSFHWASTLRHEMSHVFILAATNYRVPRWFTEGLAVHEETEASPEWGDPVTPDILAAMRDKKLLPIADLDRGFVRPEYPDQVIVSYFQAGRICDYIKSRWGDDKLLDMVHAFAQRTPTADVVRQTLGMEPEEFDKQFMEWLNNQVGKEVANFDQWVKDLKVLAQSAKDKNYDAVLEQGEKVRQLYPDYVYTANAYEFLTEAYLAKGNKQSAKEVLTDYEKRGGRNPEALKKLASLEEEGGDPIAAAATLDRINYFYPVNDEELHRHLGTLWFDQKNYAGALREFAAVVALHPLDQADAQYNLARAYLAEGERDKAEEHILASLEAAPSFRPAQQMLLQIEDSEKGKP